MFIAKRMDGEIGAREENAFILVVVVREFTPNTYTHCTK